MSEDQKSAPSELRVRAMEIALEMAQNRTHDHHQVIAAASAILEFLEGPDVVNARKEASAQNANEAQRRPAQAQRGT